jgi:hypothetical protein
MIKKNQQIASIPSYYPSCTEHRATQRAQMETSKREAADFASKTFLREDLSWWRRLFRLK